MTAKLEIHRMNRRDHQMDIAFRLAGTIDVTDTDALRQAAEDLIVQHAHKQYPGQTITVASLSVDPDGRGHACVRAFQDG